MAWFDGQPLPELHEWVHDSINDEHPLKEELLETIVGLLV